MPWVCINCGKSTKGFPNGIKECWVCTQSYERHEKREAMKK